MVLETVPKGDTMGSVLNFTSFLGPTGRQRNGLSKHMEPQNQSATTNLAAGSGGSEKRFMNTREQVIDHIGSPQTLPVTGIGSSKADQTPTPNG